MKVWISCSRGWGTGNCVKVWKKKPERITAAGDTHYRLSDDCSILDMYACNFLSFFGFRPKAGKCVEGVLNKTYYSELKTVEFCLETCDMDDIIRRFK